MRWKHFFIEEGPLTLGTMPMAAGGMAKKTIEDDMHPGSDHPQYQHRKVGLGLGVILGEMLTRK